MAPVDQPDFPTELEQAFKAADCALHYLHQAMSRHMIRTPGKDNWREVYGMRLKLDGQIRPMAENCFRRKRR